MTGFSKPPAEVLNNLGIEALDNWQAGDARVANTILKHKENGFRLRSNIPDVDFEERVGRLLERFTLFGKN